MAIKIDFENGPFLTALNQVVLQGIKKSFEGAHLDAKMYWISSATPWNSITVITLAQGDASKRGTAQNFNVKANNL